MCRGGGLASGCHPLPRLGPTWLGDQCSPGGRKPTRLGSPARERAAIDSRASALPPPRSAVPAATPRTRASLGAILLPAASRCAPGTPSPQLCPWHLQPTAARSPRGPWLPLYPLTQHPGFPQLLSSAHSVRARASASSALIPPGLSAACGLAWLCREVGASSCRVLALPRPVSSSVPPLICDGSRPVPRWGPHPRCGRCAAGPGSWGLRLGACGSRCSGVGPRVFRAARPQLSVSPRCTASHVPVTRLSAASSAGVPTWGPGGPTGRQIIARVPGRDGAVPREGPFARSRSLSWSRAQQAG